MSDKRSEFTIRPYDDADKAAFLELVKRVWSFNKDPEARFHQRWWWQRAKPPLFLLEDGSRLIGFCGHIPFSLRAGGREVPSAWFVDFFVLPEYQGKGLGKRLTKMVQDRGAVTGA